MCGRFTLHHSSQDVIVRFGAQETLFHFPPRYNIAPTQPVAVVTQNAFGDGQRVLEAMRWGLVPSWARDDSMGAGLINARAETLADKPAFRTPLKRKRCLIPADGFYEWRTEGKLKLPAHIRFRDHRLFAFAGLWEEWQAPDGSPLRSCTIVTGRPNGLLAGIQYRMAVILRPELEACWLDSAFAAPAALSLLEVFPEDEMEIVAVDPRMGNVAVDDPECIRPWHPSPAPPTATDGQLTLL